jgi:hypothetical protein
VLAVVEIEGPAADAQRLGGLHLVPLRLQERRLDRTPFCLTQVQRADVGGLGREPRPRPASVFS